MTKIKNIILNIAKPSFYAGFIFLSGVPGVQAELPVPHSSFAWSNNARIGVRTNNYMQIVQNEGRSGNWMLHWDTFNISEDSEVEFVQPGPTHIALNQIYSLDASEILGSLTANGRVYLINQNGFLFGPNSTVNVNSLVASTLAINMTQDEFINGEKNIATLINEGQPAFSGTSVDGAKVDIKAGAQITAEQGGNILLIGPNVNNEGNITATSGQVLLAATDDKVYLTPSTDPSLRGFLIEVGTATDGETGNVLNAGHILSTRGNITLAGLAINNDGILEATSTVNENGSIRLLARNEATMVDNDFVSNENESVLRLGIDVNSAKDANGEFIKNEEYAVATNTGDIILGENSRITISPEEILDEKTLDDVNDIVTLTDVQEQEVSRVELTGRSILLESDSEIVAQGGEVFIHATSDPFATALQNAEENLQTRDNSQFVMESGSRIDVSGTTSATVEMDRNELEVQLTGNFLRDAPIQRDGELRNDRVLVDIREGTPLGDISDLVTGVVERGAVERFSEGGSVSILSQGGVALESGSEINIRGGAVNYEEGYITTSQLVSVTGEIVDISDANPDQVYSGVFGQETLISDRWGEDSSRSWSLFGGSGVTRFYQAYTEGREGGNLNIQTHAAMLNYNLVSGTTNGAYQRDMESRALGGEVNIALSDLVTPFLIDDPEFVQAIEIVDEVDESYVVKDTEGNDVITTDASDALNQFLASADSVPNWVLQINNDQLNSGLTSFNVESKGRISVTDSAPINLTSGGSLSLDGRSVDVQSDIKTASGSISLSSFNDLVVNAEINTDGNWTNDDPFIETRDLQSDINLNGGSINLSTSSGDLLLAESRLTANSGAWLNSDGKLIPGDGGSVNLSVEDVVGEPANIEIGEMQAFGTANGGELSITANQILITDNIPENQIAGELVITPEFFRQNGFSDYTLISNTDNFTLEAGTQIAADSQSILLSENIKQESSTGGLSGISEIVQLADYLRPATNLTFSSNRLANSTAGYGNGLLIEDSARIELQPGAVLNLSGERNLVMNGDIVAPGGNVNLTLTLPGNSTGIKEYENDQAIWLGGSIDVRGTFVEGEPTDTGLLLGSVLNAGSVNLEAQRGYVVTGEDSIINISGEVLENEIDLPGEVIGNSVVSYERQQVVTDAGDVSLTAAEGVLLFGELSGQAANIEGAKGGELTVSVDTTIRGGVQANGSGSLNGTTESRVIHVVQTSDSTELPESVVQGSEINDELKGEAWIIADEIEQSGFTNLNLIATHTATANGTTNRGVVEFHDDINLSLDQSLQITSAIIRGSSNEESEVTLSGPYVSVGSVTGSQPEVSDLITGGNSQLVIRAGNENNDGLLAFSGNIYFQGINNINLISEGDIRLDGIKAIPADTELVGSIQSFSDINFQADQVYASTLSQFDLNVADSEGVIRIDAGGEHAPVLSAGSVLNFNAAVIEQSGVIKAPQGQINFNATDRVTLEEGSLTSVSGEGLVVPLGSTLGQERWVYFYGRNDTNNNFDGITAPPAKEVNIQAPNIQLNENSVVDISGGGDLYAWEFVPGLGGSVDTLTQENANGAFAVIPGLNGYAPFDTQNWLGVEGIEFGDQVYLNASELLEEGLYTVLPPRYALLPDAVLVTPTNDNLLPSQNYQRLDGAPVVAGQSRIAGTNYSSQFWQGYVLENGETLRQRSEYFESFASNYFREQAIDNGTVLPSMPEDAGALNILAENSLNLSGRLQGDAGSVELLQEGEILEQAGRGSLVNIGGNDIRIVNEVPDSDISDGVIRLFDDDLNTFGATSLMIGGTRERSEEGLDVTETATSVTMQNGSEVNVPDLFLVSQDSITVENGATINAAGNDALLDTRINLDGDGALLRASASDQIIINRINESVSPTQGNIAVEQGAIIKADKSIAFDSSADTDLKGTIQFNIEDAGSLSLGASQISIGDVTGNPDGLVFTRTDLEQINVNELVLSSRSSVGFFGDLDLRFNNFSIQSGSVDGYQAANDSLVLRADSLSLSNPTGEVPLSGIPDGQGTLSVIADDIVLGEGDSIIRGFDDINLEAKQSLYASGEGSTTSSAYNVTIDAASLSVNNNQTDYLVDFSGSLLTLQNTSDQTVANDEILGAELLIQADTINHSGNIRLASGYLELKALNGDVNLLNGSVTNLSGIERDFAGESIYTPGGELTLSSINQNVVMQSSALINVSGGGENGASGNAGQLSVNATLGNTDLAGQLEAQHGNEANGGGVFIDTLSISDFSDLNNILNNKGFTQQRHVRLRNGNLNIAANDEVISHDVLLQSDNGAVSVSGNIDATGNKGGRVQLIASGDVTVNGTGFINARALSTDGEGGDVRVETTNGFVNLASTSEINVTGGENYRDGTIYIRTPRAAIGSDVGVNDLDVNITSVASNMTGFRRLDVEAFEVNILTDGTVDKNDIDIATAAAYMGSQDFTQLDFAVPTDNVHIRPGFELRPDIAAVGHPENLIINTSLDFLTDTFSGESSVLTIRSENNLTVNNDISDGFLSIYDPVAFLSTGGNPAVAYDSLQTGETWSYNFVAGADFTSANSMSITNQGDFQLAANKYIRTGTGEIRVAAGNDINLHTDAAIYTAGLSNGRGGLETDLNPYLGPFHAAFGVPANFFEGSNFLDSRLLPEVEFPEEGGDVSIAAGNNIEANSSSRLITDWLHRTGDSSSLGEIGSTWGINFEAFNHGVGALGGGDVYIQAGGDINNLQVSIPETGKQTGELSVATYIPPTTFVTSFSGSEIETNGRGDINLTSGGSINNAVYYVGNGSTNINARDDIGSVNEGDGVLLISANTQHNIYAGGDLYFQGANNQTLLPFSVEQQNVLATIGVTGTNYTSHLSYYSTLSEQSEINLFSLSGDIVVRNSEDVQESYYSNITLGDTSTGNAKNRIANILPPRFNAVSVSGDVNINNSIILWPGDNSKLSILANNSILVDDFDKVVSFRMLDNSLESIPSPEAPSSDFNVENFPTQPERLSLTHVGNNETSRIVANTGDILTVNPLNEFLIQTNQQTEVVAGRDLVGVSLDVQHSNASDISVMQAGRDFVHINRAEIDTGTSKVNSVKVAGPGELHVLAGRNISLGDQKGIISVGNNENTLLPNDASDLIVMAGLGENGADYNAFIDNYFTAESEYAERLLSFMQEKDSGITDFESALTAFIALKEKQQREFVLNAFSNEYRSSAVRAASEQAGMVFEDGEVHGYSRGLDAIEILFPGTIVEKREAVTGEVTGDNLLVTGGNTYVIEQSNPNYNGNLSMVASTIQVQDDGGDISIASPGGFLNVGLSVATGDDDVEKGIITKGNGAIDIYAFGDVAVNQSRIQALNTGGISIWSTQGNVDAGRGAKSALSFPPPRNVVDPESGAIIQVLDAAVQGNGIRTACFDTNCVAGDVVLAAPKGIIDAGDAGINSGSGIILATETVLNANQIEAGGETTGVPADTGSLGANIGNINVNSAGEEAGTELVATDASDQFGNGAIAILQVEVMGLSDDPVE